MRNTALFLLEVACALALLSQTAVLAQVRAPLFRAESAEVSIDVSVIKHGHFVIGLDIGDFDVLDEGVRQPISAVSERSVPLNLLLLLDESGSMRSWDDTVGYAAASALHQLNPADRVAVVAFGANSVVEQPLTQDRTLILRAIQRSEWDPRVVRGGATLIYYAIRSSVESLQNASGERIGHTVSRAIVILTDNMGKSPDVTRKELLKKLLQANVSLWALVAPYPALYNNQPKMIEPSSPLMDDVFPLIDATGGDAAPLSNEMNLKGLFASVRDRYTLSYREPPGIPGAFRKIKVKLAAEARHKHRGVSIRGRIGYYHD